MDNFQNEYQICQEIISSMDYYDLIIEYGGNLDQVIATYNPNCIQIINDNYVVIHGVISDLLDISLAYSPACFSPLLIKTNLSTSHLTYSDDSSADGIFAADISAIENAGILTLFNLPFLELRGKGVLIAIIDSGIDYTHPSFANKNNTSKIISIWDQTLVGTPPKGFLYGTEYPQELINIALASSDPLSIVPSIDSSGSGTFLAGVAAGRDDNKINFSGAAPNSELIVVKLKPAKDYLRIINIIDPEATIYQENDIMLAIKFVLEKANHLNRPLVICMSLGTNMGSHDGRSILEEYLSIISTYYNTCIVTAMGNEATLARHTIATFTQDIASVNIPLQVGPKEPGFLLNIWGEAPDSFSIGIVTPTGESVQQLPARIGQKDTISFIMESTTIFIEYHIIENRTGGPLIIMRFSNPSEGLWTIKLVRLMGVNQVINVWLPCCGWISENTYFLEPVNDTTLLVPASALNPISVGGYNHRTNSTFIYSSLGNTRYNFPKPDFVAPAVNVYGPIPNSSFGIFSGTSIAAAITAGAAALLFEWGINRPEFNINSNVIKSLIIKGATRNPNILYHNKEIGYGVLNLANTFRTLRNVE